MSQPPDVLLPRNEVDRRAGLQPGATSVLGFVPSPHPSAAGGGGVVHCTVASSLIGGRSMTPDGRSFPMNRCWSSSFSLHRRGRRLGADKLKLELQRHDGSSPQGAPVFASGLPMHCPVRCPPFRVSERWNTLKRAHQTGMPGSGSHCVVRGSWRLSMNRRKRLDNFMLHMQHGIVRVGSRSRCVLGQTWRRLTNLSVVQIGNLLYRRLAVGRASALRRVCGLPIRDTSDCQSALPRQAGSSVQGAITVQRGLSGRESVRVRETRAASCGDTVHTGRG